MPFGAGGRIASLGKPLSSLSAIPLPPFMRMLHASESGPAASSTTSTSCAPPEDPLVRSRYRSSERRNDARDGRIPSRIRYSEVNVHGHVMITLPSASCVHPQGVEG